MTIRTLALSATLLASLPLPASAQVAVDPARLSETVRTLASDTFLGRAPGTPGEDRTVGYLIARFADAGLEPAGPDGSWVQKVPLLHTRLKTPATLEFNGPKGATPLTLSRDVYLSTIRPDDAARIANAPIVFVGYGTKAPERGWDDFKGADLKGKVVVFLINDPDFEATLRDAVNGKFGGRAMTYYGRWTYKFEEAARQGAIGALIVHDTPGAGYGWNVVISPGGENYDIVRKPADLTSLALQGWISGDAATSLFTSAGLDLAKLRTAARAPKFRPVTLNGVTFNADIPVDHEQVTSHNILGRITGAKRPDEAVMFGAHWDAYGAGKPDELGRIYRAGANDDALGVAGILDIARTFKAGPAPERTVMFAAWTAEERGLLGSEFYAANPVQPLDRTVAVLDIDILQTAGLANDVVLVGKGQNSLEDDMARKAAASRPKACPSAGCSIARTTSPSPSAAFP